MKWITPYLGTSPRDALSEPPADLEILDVRDLVDKGGNPPAVIAAKIATAVGWIQKGKKVAVCCDYGISRSNSVAVGIIQQYEGIPFSQAVQRVLQATGEQGLKVEVLHVVRRAVAGTAAPAPAQPERVLITGGSGAIGSILTQRLAAHHALLAPSRAELNLGLGPLGLDALAAETGVKTIVHLASPRIYNSNDALGETLVMLKNVLDVCREQGLKLVYPSGWEAYSGYKTARLVADEHLALNPANVYGQTKWLAEQLIRSYHQQFGVDYLLLRISPTYGTGDKPKFIYNFISKALKHEPIATHGYLNGSPALDLLHIEDLARAFDAALRAKASGEFNIGSGKLYSTLEVAQRIVALAGSRSAISQVPLEAHTANILMDYAKAERTFGWRPRLAFEDWLADQIKERSR